MDKEINISAMSVAGKSLGPAPKKRIYMGKHDILGMSKHCQSFFLRNLSEEFSRDIDKGHPAAQPAKGRQQGFKPGCCGHSSLRYTTS